MKKPKTDIACPCGGRVAVGDKELNANRNIYCPKCGKILIARG